MIPHKFFRRWLCNVFIEEYNDKYEVKNAIKGIYNTKGVHNIDFNKYIANLESKFNMLTPKCASARVNSTIKEIPCFYSIYRDGIAPFWFRKQFSLGMFNDQFFVGPFARHFYNIYKDIRQMSIHNLMLSERNRCENLNTIGVFDPSHDIVTVDEPYKYLHCILYFFTVSINTVHTNYNK